MLRPLRVAGGGFRLFPAEAQMGGGELTRAKNTRGAATHLLFH